MVSDRERIARDLHDVVIQRLFATGLQLQGLRARRRRAPSVAARIDQAVDDLDLTIRDIRGTIFELQQPAGGLAARRDPGAGRASTRRRWASRPRCAPAGPIDTAVPAELRDQLLAVLREALSNVARHATRRAGRGRGDPGRRPAAPQRARRRHRGLPATTTESGLRNVRRRARELGGTLRAGGPRAARARRFVWTVPFG